MSACREARFDAPGGVRLFYRDDDAAPPGRVPVVCLPGLTRTSRDFADLAEILAPERRVIRPDMRGRGRSDPAPDPKTYTPGVEAQDVAALLDALGLPRAVFIGTSRGGILTALLAAQRPELVAAAALNDIGPLVDRAGLERIAVGMKAAGAPPPGWDAAVAALRTANESRFPTLSPEQWERYARTTFAEEGGALRRDFDPRLIEGVEAALAAPAPDLWPLFEALAGRPLLALRGENSDILSPETLDEMTRRLPGLRAVTVRGRGHCPFLDEPEALEAIRALLAEADAA